MIHELAGSVAITAADLAAAMGVRYSPASLSETRAGLLDAELLPFQPPMLMSIFSATAAGFLGGTRSDLESLLSGPPRDALAIAVRAAQSS